MKSRVVAAVACALALSLCSCAGQEELAKTRAELEEVRRENAELRAQLEKHGIQPAPRNAKAPDAKVQAEVIKRWNAVAKDMPVNLANAQPNFGMVTFTWGHFGDFPHPTFKGGSAEAYGGFAKVLVAFLQAGDNLDYLIETGLLTAELQTSVPGGSGRGTGWSFANFITQFSAPTAHGDHDADTRKTLKAVADRIQPIIKKPMGGKV